MLELLKGTPTRQQRQRGAAGAAAAERLLQAFGPLHSSLPFLNEEEEAAAAAAAKPAAAAAAAAGTPQEGDLVSAEDLAAVEAEIETLTGEAVQQQQQQQQQEVGPDMELLGSVSL